MHLPELEPRRSHLDHQQMSTMSYRDSIEIVCRTRWSLVAQTQVTC